MYFYEKEPISLYLDQLELIESVNSTKQEIALYMHPCLGKVLVINGEIQHIENYQALYHEMLVHLPIAFIPKVESALILGGGSLFAANEILKYSTVKRVVLCDYDHYVLDLMEKYYPHAKWVKSDTRFQYVEDDAWSFISHIDEKYDLIINDCFNLASVSNKKAKSHYSVLASLCKTTGLCCDIIYRHIFDRQVTIDTLKWLKGEQNLALSLVSVPEYPGILHIETVWGPNNYISQMLIHPINFFQASVAQKTVENPFLFYSPDSLNHYLYLPPYIKNMFSL